MPYYAGQSLIEDESAARKKPIQIVLQLHLYM